MPHISSILIGVAQGCSTQGYVPPQKKLPTMDGSDLTRILKLRALARSTPTTSVNTTTNSAGGGYQGLYTIQYANRVSVPLCTLEL